MSSTSPSAYTFTGWVADLARDHTHALTSVARAEGLRAHEVLDAVQEAFETFLGLPQARVLVGAPEDSRAVMAAIVRNASRNMRRRHHRAREHVEAALTHEVVDPLPSVDDLLATAESHAQLVGCVNQLGAVQRRVVTMRMLEEVSGEEAAAELGLSAGHVAVLLHRAKRTLAECMGT